MTIENRVAELRTRIERAGGTEVTLLAASKGASADAVSEAWQAGVRHFGENYLQESLTKRPSTPEGAIWHFIGRLQSNKISRIAEHFTVIQTVDSASKATKLSSAASAELQVFLEVNIAEEPQK